MGKRNTVGGKKGKGMANKALNTNNNTQLRLSISPYEKYACVTKLNGNGMCNIITEDHVTLLAHIRGNMRGASKRNNFITPFSIVLIGLREWESTPKNCDILYIYSSSDISYLSNIPTIHISSLLALHHNPLSFNNSNSSLPSDNLDHLFNHDDNNNNNTTTTTTNHLPISLNILPFDIDFI
jgi:translation initiation factor IF-1